VSIDYLGNIITKLPGVANFTATVGAQQASIQVTVNAVSINLTHRWSFDTDLNDSIGGADGIAPVQGGQLGASGGLVLTNGSVVMQGSSGGAGFAYVALPGGLFTGYGQVAVETWYIDYDSPEWSRVWDFGNGQVTNFFQTHYAGGSGGRVGITVGGSGAEYDSDFTRPIPGIEHMVAYSLDAIAQTATTYVDGVIPPEKQSVYNVANLTTGGTNVPIQPQFLEPTTLASTAVGDPGGNDIGRSQYNDPNAIMAVDELRIWNGPISLQQVLLDIGAGPENVINWANDLNSGSGTFQSNGVVVTNMTTGITPQQAQLMGYYFNNTQFTNAVPVYYTPYASNWVSSSPSIADINPTTGLITAHAAGATTISGTWNGITASSTLTVTAGSTTLLHRWSFGDTAGSPIAVDSVGGSSMWLSNRAGISNGVLNLPGGSNGAGYAKMQMPGVVPVGDFTVETWATFPSTTASGSVLWDFGSTFFGLDMRFSPLNGLNNVLTLAGNEATGGLTSPTWFNDPGSFGTNEEYYAWVFNASASKLNYYINGALAASFPYAGMQPRGLPDAGATAPFGIMPVPIWMFNPGTGLQSTDSNGAPTYVIATNGYLGHRVTSTATADFTGSIDEFRIWQGALGPVAIATSYALGPNSLISGGVDPGAPTAVSLTVPDPTQVVGMIQTPIVSATFGTVNGHIPLSGSTALTFSSDNSAAVAVTSDERLKAVGAGVAHITATYHGFTSAAATVTVVTAASVTGGTYGVLLTHRYSFRPGYAAADSVGNAHGSVNGGAVVSNGKLVLNGVGALGTGLPASYVSLPKDLITGYSQMTIEGFATVGSAPSSGGPIVNFSLHRVGTGAADNYLFYAPSANGNSNNRIGFQDAAVITNEIDTLASSTVGGANIPANASFSFAAVMDSTAGRVSVYTNGVYSDGWTNTTTAPFSLANVIDAESWIGARFDHTMYVGTIDDVRIYDGLLDSVAGQVAASAALGADPDTVTLTQVGGNVTVKWPATAVTTGMSLEGATSPTGPYTVINSGITTAGGVNTYGTTVGGSNPIYFRLIQTHVN
jgi:hypothetical protein